MDLVPRNVGRNEKAIAGRGIRQGEVKAYCQAARYDLVSTADDILPHLHANHQLCLLLSGEYDAI